MALIDLRAAFNCYNAYIYVFVCEEPRQITVQGQSILLSLGFGGGKQLFNFHHVAAPNQILMRSFHFLIIAFHLMYFQSICALIYINKEKTCVKKLPGCYLRPIDSSQEYAVCSLTRGGAICQLDR